MQFPSRRVCRALLLALLMMAALRLRIRSVMAQSPDSPLPQVGGAGSALPPLPFAYAYTPSPNCDERPPGAVVDCIVLHATVEPTTEATMKIFLDPARRVSAHFVVGKDGRVVQMVPVEKRAWHAGPA